MTRTNNTDLKDVWQTPTELLEYFEDSSTKIDLDPCAGEGTTVGQVNYTEQDDGLSKAWFGRVFVNPPFSEKTDWLKKAVSEYQSGNTKVIFIVTPDSTDVISWWHGYIAEHADYVWFSEGRISYVNPETGEAAGSPTFGTAVSILGEPEQFVLENLSENGHLVETVSPNDCR
jgi:phage N-6-adenine-methyltransferase